MSDDFKLLKGHAGKAFLDAGTEVWDGEKFVHVDPSGKLGPSELPSMLGKSFADKITDLMRKRVWCETCQRLRHPEHSHTK